MEAVGVEEFVEDDALGRQPVVRVVLIIFVAVTVDTDAFPPEQVVLLFDDESS